VSLSPVIAAIVGEEQARGAVRFSLGEETTEAEIDFAISAFERVVSRV
jgi:cysteine sulfinate desulfinase/cysteine desulfurase-like protein